MVPDRRRSAEHRAVAVLFEPGGLGSSLEVGRALFDQQRHVQPFAGREPDRFTQQSLTGVFRPADLRDVDGLIVHIEADEPQQLGFEGVGIGVGVVAGLLPLGDPDAAVVDEVPDDIARHVGQCRYRFGVLFDGVPDIHMGGYRMDAHKFPGESH